MELLEADFAQIEHINQILLNNRGCNEWSYFETYEVIKAYNELIKIQYPNTPSAVETYKIGNYDETNPSKSTIKKNIVNVRYDFFIVTITQIDDNTWKYSFEIRNAMWDGAYRISKSKNKTSDVTEWFDKGQVVVSRNHENENNVTFTVTGDGSDRVRVAFHLNLNSKGRNIQTTSIHLETGTEYTHQFNASKTEEGYVKSDEGAGVADALVTIEPVDKNGLPISGGIETQTVKTDEKGYFEMTYSEVSSPGDYYVQMTAIKDDVTTSQLIHIKKLQLQSIVIDWGDSEQYNTGVYKGSVKTFNIPFHIADEFGVHDIDKKLDEQLVGLNINVSWKPRGGKEKGFQSCVISKDSKGKYSINPQIDFRKYYENIATLVVDIPESTGFTGTQEHLIQLDWYTAQDYTDLVKTTQDVNGPDWIFLEPKTYTRTETLTINREITLAGTNGTNPCTINGNNQSTIVINSPSPAKDNYMKVNIIGIKFTNSQGAIKQNTGSRLLIDRCYFTGNKNDNQHHVGCSIYMPINDETRRNQDLWKTEIRNTRFHNNKGNEIQSIGKTYIHNNMFSTTSADSLQQPEVKVVTVRAGEVKYIQNKSYIDIPFKNKSDAMSSNHSYAKALAYIDTGAKFNGKGPANLKGNDTLPLFGSEYQNEAYTRACYYYPYENVKTYIVCSPEKGKERRATGHASSAKGWVFYDGYYFTRLENNGGNTTNPWSARELELPTNTGIYNPTTKKFITGYSPLYSNNQAQVSAFDSGKKYTSNNWFW